MQSDYDNNLQSYFTDMEHLRGMFKDFVSAEKLPKRLIVFHGVGGVGKSSLLRMFRLHCKSEKVPVALASGDDTKSVLDVITRWAEDLKEDGIKFPAFGKTMEAYRAIQAKVEDQTKKSQNRVADIASKAASKTAETAGGALLGAAIGSVIPGVGTAIGGALGGVVSGMGAEALTDWLRGFLTKPDIDLLLDPAKKLSADFLEDIAKAAEKKRIVLLLDTFEQMSALEDWVGEMAQKIHPNALVVIAGRKLPDWQRVWHGWMMNANVEELKPMTEDIMRQLIHRYYSTMRGGEPDPAQVEAIIKFARGLPMVVTSAVQLWVKYGVEDFQSVKVEIVANLVDRLMEGVPSALIPALEAVAVVRWFDQPILRAVMNKEDVRDLYNELRRFPFVRTRAEGLALHDSVREMIDENLYVQDSERHADLHERAAAYFEKKLEKVTGENAERLGLERLYHRVRANEEAGMKLFQEMAENLRRYRFINYLNTLLNDASTYPLERENSQLWRKYYDAIMQQLNLKWDDAERLYLLICNSEHADSKLKSYSLCSLGYILSRWQRLGEKDQIEKVKEILKQSSNLIPLDNYIIANKSNLAHIHEYQGEWAISISYAQQIFQFFSESQDDYGQLEAYRQYITDYGYNGDWSNLILVYKNGIKILDRLPKQSHARAKFLGWTKWAWGFAGQLHSAEHDIRESLRLAELLGDKEAIRDGNRDLGLLLSQQDRNSEAAACFEKALQIAEEIGDTNEIKIAYIHAWWSVLLVRQKEFQLAENKLNYGLEILQRFQTTPDIPLMYIWLGHLMEIQFEWEKALNWFSQGREMKWMSRTNLECEALTSVTRVKHAQGDLAAIPSLLAEAEKLAQKYEYNDHLASLRLTQGHLKAETSEVSETSEVLGYYKQAMIYALRYNRFLLDELLSGRPQGTPLRPIIPYCLERGDEGRKILSALRDWWKTGVNDIGTPRPDTISPIPEGIPLSDAEKLAREREPGDGATQRSVLEQLEKALSE